MVMTGIHETRMHVIRKQNEGTRLYCNFCLEARMTLIKSKHKSQHGQQVFTKSRSGNLQWLWEYGLETAAVGRVVGSSCTGTCEILQRHPETCVHVCVAYLVCACQHQFTKLLLVLVPYAGKVCIFKAIGWIVTQRR